MVIHSELGRFGIWQMSALGSGYFIEGFVDVCLQHLNYKPSTTFPFNQIINVAGLYGFVLIPFQKVYNLSNAGYFTPFFYWYCFYPEFSLKLWNKNKT